MLTTKKHPNRANATKARPDFQASDALPEDTDRRHRKMGHQTRIDKYRDRIFQLLASTRMDPAIFDQIDRQSQRELDALSENSQVALVSDFLGYLKHVLAVGREEQLSLAPFPVTDRALDRYLDALIGEGYKYSTVSRHMNTLRTWHKWAGLPDPTNTDAIRPRLKRIQRSSAGAIAQKKPLQMAHLVKAVELHNENVLRDVADLALLYTAFETGCRRSELVGFEWHDLTRDTDDDSGLLFLVSSKTDQEQEGAYLYLSPVTMAMLDYWQQRCGRQDGKIFRGIYSDGRLASALSTQGVAKAFKRIARKLGLPEFDFGGHSTRIGGAIDQMTQGVELGQIMLSGRWKSPEMVMRYTRQTRAKDTGMAQLTRGLADWTPEKVLKKHGNQPALEADNESRRLPEPDTYGSEDEVSGKNG